MRTPDSKEEIYLGWYFNQLKRNGYVEYFSNDDVPEYGLSEGIEILYKKPMKRVKDKLLRQTLLKGSVYNPDYKVVWTKKALGIFVTLVNLDDVNPSKITTPFYVFDELLTSIIECKPNMTPYADRSNSIRIAMSNIKFVWDKHGAFVQMIKVPGIFKSTFTPERYLLTDKTKQPRKIKFKTTKLEDYVGRIKERSKS